MKLKDITFVEYCIVFAILFILGSIVKSMLEPKYEYVLPEHLQIEKTQKIDKCIHNVTLSQTDDVERAIIQCKLTYDDYYADMYRKVKKD